MPVYSLPYLQRLSLFRKILFCNKTLSCVQFCLFILETKLTPSTHPRQQTPIVVSNPTLRPFHSKIGPKSTYSGK